MFRAAVDAALPARVLPRHLPQPPTGRTIVIGAGKAGGSMAKAVEDHWPGPLEGLVVTRYGHALPCRRIEVVEASHPVPDEAGRQAAERILRLVQSLTRDDLVLCLISGGGSALMALPALGIAFADKQTVNKALLKSGATIAEINCVRKHLSAIKGGRLAAAAAPARVVTLMISDVPGDDPSVIASGPTVADATTREDALSVLDKYGIDGGPAVRAWLARPESETPKPNDPRLSRVENIVIARPQDALEAAAAVARRAGYTPLILGDAIEGEAREVALVHAGIARQCAGFAQPAAPPCVLLSGGETTVTVHGKGRGGRNRRIPVGACGRVAGTPRHSCDRLRYRWDRRHGGQCRRPIRARHVAPRRRAPNLGQSPARRQRRLRLLCRGRRPCHHGADIHQRQ